ncbi:NADPH-dependent F420 reductase [Luteimonas vadosa]|uniref:Pyrroline-5-carboxylate reductase catalytic N-terminal domain-containing protein n=1 Tax=Luteimonas vadosa TaxID=1165507 RepID=A0ABP9ECN6_9GAMM
MILLVVVGLGGFVAPVAAQDEPVVAMIGTGTLADTFGPAIGRAGYTVVYGSREPARPSVRALVEKTGSEASAASPREAASNAQIVILAVPRNVLDDVTDSLGELDGKIVVDVSGGMKRVAADGYLELIPGESNSERIQSRHPNARVVRINLPLMAFFVDPMLVGTPPTILIAGDDPAAREAVARLIFDLGLDPWDAGPLRFSQVFDAMNTMALVPSQQGRIEGYEWRLMPSAPLSCFTDVSKLFGFGHPKELDSVRPFPRRDQPIPCDEWRRRLGW